MKVFNIAGYVSCESFIEAKQALLGLQTIFPTEYLVHVIEFASQDEYMSWLIGFRNSIQAPEHQTSPIVWYDDGKYLGGFEEALAQCRKGLKPSPQAKGQTTPKLASTSILKKVKFDSKLTSSKMHSSQAPVVKVPTHRLKQIEIASKFTETTSALSDPSANKIVRKAPIPKTPLSNTTNTSTISPARSSSHLQRNINSISPPEKTIISLKNLSSEDKIKIKRLIEKLLEISNENEDLKSRLISQKEQYEEQQIIYHQNVESQLTMIEDQLHVKEDTIQHLQVKEQMLTSMICLYQMKLKNCVDVISFHTKSIDNLQQKITTLEKELNEFVQLTNQQKEIIQQKQTESNKQENIQKELQELQQTVYMKNELIQLEQLKNKQLNDLNLSLVNKIFELEHSNVNQPNIINSSISQPLPQNDKPISIPPLPMTVDPLISNPSPPINSALTSSNNIPKSIQPTPMSSIDFSVASAVSSFVLPTAGNSINNLKDLNPLTESTDRSSWNISTDNQPRNEFTKSKYEDYSLMYNTSVEDSHLLDTSQMSIVANEDSLINNHDHEDHEELQNLAGLVQEGLAFTDKTLLNPQDIDDRFDDEKVLEEHSQSNSTVKSSKKKKKYNLLNSLNNSLDLSTQSIQLFPPTKTNVLSDNRPSTTEPEKIQKLEKPPKAKKSKEPKVKPSPIEPINDSFSHLANEYNHQMVVKKKKTMTSPNPSEIIPVTTSTTSKSLEGIPQKSKIHPKSIDHTSNDNSFPSSSGTKSKNQLSPSVSASVSNLAVSNNVNKRRSESNHETTINTSSPDFSGTKSKAKKESPLINSLLPPLPPGNSDEHHHSLKAKLKGTGQTSKSKSSSASGNTNQALKADRNNILYDHTLFDLLDEMEMKSMPKSSQS